MEHASRKELAAAYKTKKQVGGVYCIVIDTDGRCLLKCTADLAVDTLEKKEDWDDKRFIREVRLLAEIWKENLDKNWY